MISLGTEHCGAVFSDNDLYRYRLWRHVGTPEIAGCIRDRRVAFLMLNPSTATESKNDPTVRRCIYFAMRWGAEWLDVINLFALRATDPRELRGGVPPIGPDNDAHLDEVAARAGLVLCAWGRHGAFLGRGDEVRTRLIGAGIKLYHFGENTDGTPKHPLYQKNERPAWPWLTGGR